MSLLEQTKSPIIRLSHANGRVIVEPDDEDRFVLTAQCAVKACQHMQRGEEAIRLFKEDLVLPLHDWCGERSEKVKACYIPVPLDCIRIFVVGCASRFDFELGSDIAALEMALADTGWRVNVLQLPLAESEELQTYFDIQGAIEIDAEFQTTSGKGGA